MSKILTSSKGLLFMNYTRDNFLPIDSIRSAACWVVMRICIAEVIKEQILKSACQDDTNRFVCLIEW